MRCPVCSGATRVNDSADTPAGTLRHRQCLDASCNKKFSTLEAIVRVNASKTKFKHVPLSVEPPAPDTPWQERISPELLDVIEQGRVSPYVPKLADVLTYTRSYRRALAAKYAKQLKIPEIVLMRAYDCAYKRNIT